MGARFANPTAAQIAANVLGIKYEALERQVCRPALYTYMPSIISIPSSNFPRNLGITPGSYFKVDPVNFRVASVRGFHIKVEKPVPKVRVKCISYRFSAGRASSVYLVIWAVRRHEVLPLACQMIV